jgi:hypothetical protein
MHHVRTTYCIKSLAVPSEGYKISTETSTVMHVWLLCATNNVYRRNSGHELNLWF